MSIIYCEKHDRHWDSDFKEGCPVCENEPTPNEVCAYCGHPYQYPVSYHHTEKECQDNLEMA